MNRVIIYANYAQNTCKLVQGHLYRSKAWTYSVGGFAWCFVTSNGRAYAYVPLSYKKNKTSNYNRWERKNLIGHESSIGVLNDWRECPVIIEKNYYLLPLRGIRYQLEHLQRRRMMNLLSFWIYMKLYQPRFSGHHKKYQSYQSLCITMLFWGARLEFRITFHCLIGKLLFKLDFYHVKNWLLSHKE